MTAAELEVRLLIADAPRYGRYDELACEASGYLQACDFAKLCKLAERVLRRERPCNAWRVRIEEATRMLREVANAHR
jgi:hypothetical protein